LQHGDATHYHHWLIFAQQVAYCRCDYFELPVFTPNEYFWNHHWDGKEEKWVAYARAIREIIAEQGDFQVYDVDMEDKLAFKQHIRGKKGTHKPKSD